MGVLIANESGVVPPMGDAEIAEAVAAVLAAEGVERDVEVSVTLVDDERMRELNAAWRDIDAPTDVLSFECDSPADEGIPEDETLELGDIVLAPRVIAAQAPAFGMSEVEEFRIMLVHGMLHLLGYDHLDDAEAEVMEAHELAILRRLAELRGENPEQVKLGPTTHHRDD